MNYKKDLEIGIKRSIDDLVRVSIPAEMRRHLEFSKKQLVSIKLYSYYIIIAKKEYSCCFCGSKYNFINYKKIIFVGIA